ncbi:MAG: glycosyltransferase family 4 protein [Candidatus Wukongarchaeota archaeon]|nr:glycosyltransferase family 4 protein [Candidatus Wukongarchaeota archaeon]
MRVAHIAPFAGEWLGGTERYCFQLSKILAKKHDVHIFASTLSRDTSCVEEVSGVTIHRFYAPKVVWNINPIVFMMPALWKEKFDVVHVHSHLYFSSVQASFLRIFRKYPLLLHIHGGLGIPPMGDTPFMQKFAKVAYDKSISPVLFKIADKIASVCKYDLKTLEEKYNVPPEKLIHVPNAVDIDLFKDVKPFEERVNKDPRIAFVGDMEIWKGPEYVLKAHRILEKENIKAELIMVGEGSLKQKLQRLSSSRVKFTGQVPHEKVINILGESNLFTLPSLWEGAPTTILEAMASTTPVVASSVGGIPELIQNEKTGMMVPPSNVVSLANSLKRLIEEPDLSKYIAKNAKTKVSEENEFKKVAGMLEKIYEEMVESH